MKEKYIIHQNLGLPIRIPPYLRRGLSLGDHGSHIQLEMIRSCPVVGERTPDDTVDANINENIRLRKIARIASHLLTTQAEQWEAERFCTIIHGSLARGLVRKPTHPDKSDIDIDLVVDNIHITKDQAKVVRQFMYESSEQLGARIDSYVFTMQDIKRDYGNYARLYLASSAYPIANEGNLWKDIVIVGLMGKSLSIQKPTVRAKIKKVFPLIEQQVADNIIIESLGESDRGKEARQYLIQFGFLGDHSDRNKNVDLIRGMNN